MSESPVKKKTRIANNDARSDQSPSDINSTVDEPIREEVVQTQNSPAGGNLFIEACKRVSREAYFNYKKRFGLSSIPKCIKGSCQHELVKLRQISQAYDDALLFGLDTHSWLEVIDSLQIFLENTTTTYLSAQTLRTVVEIMLNAHGNEFFKNLLPTLLKKCKAVLTLHFNKFPTCASHKLKKTYKQFLTGPMDEKRFTCTRRQEFQSNKGIARYCFNILDYEMSPKAPDGPIIDIIETDIINGKSVREISTQRRKNEIFETLPRKDRIYRIMFVLDTIIEILQLDLSIWQSKCHSDNHILSCRPLAASVLWADDIIFTANFNDFIITIIRIYANFISLNYPQHYIDSIGKWLNITTETVYICENSYNSDYPNVGIYIKNFSSGIYSVIKDLPNNFIIKVLKCLKPDYLRWSVGAEIIDTKCGLKDKCVLKILMQFFQNSTWSKFEEREDENKYRDDVDIVEKLPNTIQDFHNTNFAELGNNAPTVNEESYPKRGCVKPDKDFSRREMFIILLITFYAYLEANQVLRIMERIMELSKNQCEDAFEGTPDDVYYISENFIIFKRYLFEALVKFKKYLENLLAHGSVQRDYLNMFYKAIHPFRFLGMFRYMNLYSKQNCPNVFHERFVRIVCKI